MGCSADVWLTMSLAINRIEFCGALAGVVPSDWRLPACGCCSRDRVKRRRIFRVTLALVQRLLVEEVVRLKLNEGKREVEFRKAVASLVEGRRRETG